MDPLNIRDNHLDEVLGIKDVEVVNDDKPIETEIVSSKKEMPDDLEKGLKQNIKSIDDMYDSAKSILQTTESLVSSFSKSRDIEVAATLLNTMIQVQKERRETLRDLYGSNEDSGFGLGGKNSIKNQNVFIGDFRDLLTKIPEQKINIPTVFEKSIVEPPPGVKPDDDVIENNRKSRTYDLKLSSEKYLNIDKIISSLRQDFEFFIENKMNETILSFTNERDFKWAKLRIEDFLK